MKNNGEVAEEIIIPIARYIMIREKQFNSLIVMNISDFFCESVVCYMWQNRSKVL